MTVLLEYPAPVFTTLLCLEPERCHCRASRRGEGHYSHHHQALWSNMRTRVSHHRLMDQDKCVLLWPNIPPVWNEEDWILFGGVIVLQMFTIWFDCLHTRSNVFIMRLVSRQNQSKVFSGVVVKVIMFLTNQTISLTSVPRSLSQHFVIDASTFPRCIAPRLKVDLVTTLWLLLLSFLGFWSVLYISWLGLLFIFWAAILTGCRPHFYAGSELMEPE